MFGKHKLEAEIDNLRRRVEILEGRLGIGTTAPGPSASVQHSSTDSESVFPSYTPPVMPTAEPSALVRQLAADGRYVEAIKQLRSETGLGLRDAKTVVDALPSHR